MANDLTAKGAPRQHFIDIMKGIGIVMVVYGHLSVGNSETGSLLSSFRMPMFFFISGYLFNGMNKTPGQFLKRKALGLLVPYVVFYILTYLYWLLSRYITADWVVEWWRPLIGLVFGTRAFGGMAHNVPVWFIPCLFALEVIFIYIYKLTKGRPVWMLAGALIVTGFGVLFSAYNIDWLPMGLNYACGAYMFYYLGYLFKPVLNRKRNYFVLGGVLIVSILYFVFLFDTNIFANVTTNVYRHFWRYLTAGCMGTALMYAASRLINKSRPIEWVGRNTLVILCFHIAVQSTLMYIVSFITGYDAAYFYGIELVRWLLALVVVGLCVPLIFLYNRYLSPRLKFGKRQTAV